MKKKSILFLKSKKKSHFLFNIGNKKTACFVALLGTNKYRFIFEEEFYYHIFFKYTMNNVFSCFCKSFILEIKENEILSAFI